MQATSVPAARNGTIAAAAPSPECGRRVASRLDEVAVLLEQQGANPFRVRAWRRAAETVRALDTPVAALPAAPSGGPP